MRGPRKSSKPVQGLPDVLVELQTFKVLGQIVKPANQAERVLQGAECRHAQAGSHPKPRLAADLDSHAIFDRLQCYRQGGPAASAAHASGGNLDDDLVLISNLLCDQVLPVISGEQALGELGGGDLTVVNSSFH